MKKQRSFKTNRVAERNERDLELEKQRLLQQYTENQRQYAQMQNLKHQIKNGLILNPHEFQLLSFKSPDKLKLDGHINAANNLFANLQHLDGVKDEYSMVSPYKPYKDYNDLQSPNNQSQKIQKISQSTGGKEVFNVQIKNQIDASRKQNTMPSSLVPIDSYQQYLQAPNPAGLFRKASQHQQQQTTGSYQKTGSIPAGGFLPNIFNDNNNSKMNIQSDYASPNQNIKKHSAFSEGPQTPIQAKSHKNSQIAFNLMTMTQQAQSNKMTQLKSVPEYATEEPNRRSIEKTNNKQKKQAANIEKDKAKSASKKVKSQKDKQLEDLNETLQRLAREKLAGKEKGQSQTQRRRGAARNTERQPVIQENYVNSTFGNPVQDHEQYQNQEHHKKRRLVPQNQIITQQQHQIPQNMVRSGQLQGNAQILNNIHKQNHPTAVIQNDMLMNQLQLRQKPIQWQKTEPKELNNQKNTQQTKPNIPIPETPDRVKRYAISSQSQDVSKSFDNNQTAVQQKLQSPTFGREVELLMQEADKQQDLDQIEEQLQQRHQEITNAVIQMQQNLRLSTLEKKKFSSVIEKVDEESAVSPTVSKKHANQIVVDQNTDFQPSNQKVRQSIEDNESSTPNQQQQQFLEVTPYDKRKLIQLKTTSLDEEMSHPQDTINNEEQDSQVNLKTDNYRRAIVSDFNTQMSSTQDNRAQSQLIDNFQDSQVQKIQNTTFQMPQGKQLILTQDNEDQDRKNDHEIYTKSQTPVVQQQTPKEQIFKHVKIPEPEPVLKKPISAHLNIKPPIDKKMNTTSISMTQDEEKQKQVRQSINSNQTIQNQLNLPTEAQTKKNLNNSARAAKEIVLSSQISNRQQKISSVSPDKKILLQNNNSTMSIQHKQRVSHAPNLSNQLTRNLMLKTQMKRGETSHNNIVQPIQEQDQYISSDDEHVRKLKLGYPLPKQKQITSYCQEYAQHRFFKISKPYNKIFTKNKYRKREGGFVQSQRLFMSTEMASEEARRMLPVLIINLDGTMGYWDENKNHYYVLRPKIVESLIQLSFDFRIVAVSSQRQSLIFKLIYGLMNMMLYDQPAHLFFDAVYQLNSQNEVKKFDNFIKNIDEMHYDLTQVLLDMQFSEETNHNPKSSKQEDKFETFWESKLYRPSKKIIIITNERYMHDNKCYSFDYNYLFSAIRFKNEKSKKAPIIIQMPHLRVNPKISFETTHQLIFTMQYIAKHHEQYHYRCRDVCKKLLATKIKKFEQKLRKQASIKWLKAFDQRQDDLLNLETLDFGKAYKFLNQYFEYKPTDWIKMKKYYLKLKPSVIERLSPVKIKQKIKVTFNESPEIRHIGESQSNNTKVAGTTADSSKNDSFSPYKEYQCSEEAKNLYNGLMIRNYKIQQEVNAYARHCRIQNQKKLNIQRILDEAAQKREEAEAGGPIVIFDEDAEPKQKSCMKQQIKQQDMVESPILQSKLKEYAFKYRVIKIRSGQILDTWDNKDTDISNYQVINLKVKPLIIGSLTQNESEDGQTVDNHLLLQSAQQHTAHFITNNVEQKAPLIDLLSKRQTKLQYSTNQEMHLKNNLSQLVNGKEQYTDQQMQLIEQERMEMESKAEDKKKNNNQNKNLNYLDMI